MRKLNKYERRIMLNLHIITFLCIVSSILNLVLPWLERSKISIFLLSQLIAIGGIYIYGWVNSRGSQGVPISTTFIIRGLQAFIFVFWRKDISWISFGVLVFLDILLILLLVLDKSNYKYTIIRREDDEFFDQ